MSVDVTARKCHKDSRHLNEHQFDSGADAVMERVLSFILGRLSMAVSPSVCKALRSSLLFSVTGFLMVG